MIRIMSWAINLDIKFVFRYIDIDVFIAIPMFNFEFNTAFSKSIC